MRKKLAQSFLERHGLSKELSRSLESLLEEAASEVTLDDTRDSLISQAPTALAESDSRVDSVAASPDSWHDPGTRYVDRGMIGRGGMGEVRRVHDRFLNRKLAMKILRLDGNPMLEARFIAEAQVTAQLQHPAIPPVHDIGRLADGRFYFTMKEIQGHTLGRVIREAHKEWNLGSRQGAPVWSPRRLVSMLQRMCEAVAYAHDRGVIHRDLKPSNLMIGDFGEVLVLDWGLTRFFDPEGRVVAEEVITDRSQSGEHPTRFGAVIGTPDFMPPEQAGGDTSRITARSDVYSLGAVLYTILDGNAPYSDVPQETRLPVLDGPPKPLGARPSASPTTGPSIPPELKTICERAMAREPRDRYEHAGQLAHALAAWLDGAQRREQAEQILEEAHELKPKVAGLLSEAATLETTAATMLMSIPPFGPVEAKRPAWQLEDRAASLRNEARLADLRFAQLVRGALAHAGDLVEAHAMLAEHYHDQHRQAELAGDTEAMERLELLLREHDDGRFSDYLEGSGALTLVTDPPGARAVLYRFVERDRRLVPDRVADLGMTPVEGRRLAMGRYLVRLSAPGRIDVDYPVLIERQQHWNGARPGGDGPHPIYLPQVEELGSEECYVPAGWFKSGGDDRARNSLPARRLWLDGFVTPRFPVTVGEFIVFLNALLDRDREEEAVGFAPPLPEWEQGKADADQRELGVIRGADGRFRLDGPDEKLRWPVTMVNWTSANAYAEWRAAADGLPWRLIPEMEHEKASRGVDGRLFPWGNRLDPTFCAMRLSHAAQGRVLKALVDEYPGDESPYGIRGLAGNTHSWCIDTFSPLGPDVVDDVPRPPDPAKVAGPGAGGTHRMVRGGSWRDPESMCRSAYRDGPPAHYRDTCLGFRIARPLR